MERKMTRSELATTLPETVFEELSSRRIVVVVDYGRTSAEALREAAAELETVTRGQLHVLHVAPADRGPVTAHKIEQNERAVEDDREKLRRFVLEHMHELPAISRVETVLHLRYGDAPEETRHLCADVEADLIIVGTEDPTGISRLFHSSLATQMIKSAPCPVLVAKRKSYDSMATNGHERVSVEPPCPDCLRAREQSSGARSWCARHAESHSVSGHIYGYDETLSFGMHDNEVAGPTGV
jgi:nucleotide-binding universal stress UspA family protein